MKSQVRTYKYRIKSNTKDLDKMKSKVNFVWNYCNEVSVRSWTHNNKWLSFYDLCSLTKGCSDELCLNSQCIRETVKRYFESRKEIKRCKLNWRTDKRNLGWIPFNNLSLVINGDSVKFMGKQYRFWKSRDPIGKFKIGSFSQDSKGNWFVNMTCELVKISQVKTGMMVGIDLGLKSLAVTSDGEVIDGGKFYRSLEDKLATAQRANKKRQVKAIHTKIKNCRKDELHKATTKLVNQYDKIFVGDVSPSKLMKTKMSKSVSDAGWSTFKSMLAYKAIALGVEYKEVKENFSTVTCSYCSQRTGPSGLSALGVREWECSNCGTKHNRDVNAAVNILMIGLGHQAPKGVLKFKEKCQKQTHSYFN